MTQSSLVTGHEIGLVTVAGATVYCPLGTGLLASNGTESNRSVSWKSRGCFSILTVIVSASTTTTASTATLRQAAADTTVTVSMGAAATGTFVDATNQAVVANSDVMSVKHVNAAVGSMTIQTVAIQYIASDGKTRLFYNCTGSPSFTSASTTTSGFWAVAGRNTGTNQTTESTQQIIMRATGNMYELHVLVGTNSRTTTTTFRSRKNTANGNMSCSIGSTATGRFNDGSNVDAIVDGDLYCFQIVTGTGAQAIIPDQVGAHFENFTNQYQPALGAMSSVVVTSASTTLYAKYSGSLALSADASAWSTNGEALQQQPAGRPSQISNLAIRVSANARTASTFTLRVNGADTAVTTSITASTTGVFEDTTHNVVVDENDLVNVALTTGTGTNSCSFRLISTLWTDLKGGFDPVVRNKVAAFTSIR